jgi:hypothetical protein
MVLGGLNGGEKVIQRGILIVFSVKVDSARFCKMEIRFRSLLHGIAAFIGRCIICMTG